MDTYFAPGDRAGDEELAAEIEMVAKSPVMSGLLNSVGGLLAVLDEHRQIVAMNDAFLRMLGIDDPTKAFGLRPGQALQCVHADDEPAGCGTTVFCSTCGAAVAIVASIGKDKPVERICALATNKGGKRVDMTLLVRSQPIVVEKKKLFLLFLQDISQQYQRAALERTFFHDVNNMLSTLVASSDLLVAKDSSELAKNIQSASLRLFKEVAIQRCLTQNEIGGYQPMWHECATERILDELRCSFVNHPAARDKNLEISEDFPVVAVKTDISLLLRVLSNMVLNALEAAGKGDSVKVWAVHESDNLAFYVWNRQEIPEDVARRVFQRSFSTKEQAGRGIGTFSMKLFGEEILGGRVSFTTSKQDGTIFKFSHPLLS